MQRELTISIDEQVYRDLHQTVLPRQIGPLIESLVLPRLLTADLEAGYLAMAADEEHEAEALDWREALLTDIADETR